MLHLRLGFRVSPHEKIADSSDKLSLSYGVVFSLKEDTGLVGKEYANLTVWFCKSAPDTADQISHTSLARARCYT